MPCWEMRGCADDQEMLERCPHNVPCELCPADCHFAACFRPTHKVATDFNLLLNPQLDYDAGIKEICHFCEFFLTHGPCLTSETSHASDAQRPGNPNRFLL